MTSKRLSVLALGAAAASVVAQNPAPRNDSVSPYLDAVSKFIDSIEDDLWSINKKIYDNPELGMEEVKAHDILTSYMESQAGWTVERSLYNFTTAFAAVFEGDRDGPVVSFNAEYDALPELGHACGHNLIATSSLAAALATAEIMRSENLPGRVILFGTPGEEAHGGKIQMLEAGVFADYGVDVSIMAHPSTYDTPYARTSSIGRFEVAYHGREAHASAGPHEGVNAQDALALAYSAVSMLRQQSLPTDQVHGIITSGGASANVIPALATASFQVRSADERALARWTERVVACFEAGAVATGAKLNLTMLPYGYANMVTNDVMAESYASWFTGLGGTLNDPLLDKMRDPSASTDQGDVSHAFPAIHPFFAIVTANGTEPAGGPHTKAFGEAAGSKAAFERAVRAAKGLAGVAVDILTKDGLLEDIKEEFENRDRSRRMVRTFGSYR